MRRRHPDVVLAVAVRASLRVAPLLYRARHGRAGAAPARELDVMLCAVLRALAPAERRPQGTFTDEFRLAFRIAGDKAKAAARVGTYSAARAVCQSVSAVAAAATTWFDDETPRAVFAAEAVTLAAEACARGAADHAARIVSELSRRPDAKDTDDDVGGRRERDNAARAAATAAEGSGAAALWEEVQADLDWAEGFDPDSLAANGPVDRPLWAHGQPDWVRNVWSSFKVDLSLAQRWDVWIAWYEERLRGVRRGEAYESIFASVPTEEWDKGSAAANGWIRQRLEHLSWQGDPRTAPKITDRESFALWLEGQSEAVAVALAARAALRAVPLVASPSLVAVPQGLEGAAAAIFRVSAIARVMAKYGAGTDGTRAAECRAAASAAVRAAARVGEASVRVAAQSAYDAARAAAPAAGGEAFVRGLAVDAASRVTAWAEVQSDAVTVVGGGAGAVMDQPLWSASHDGIDQAWASLCNALPREHDWGVWIDWYEKRVRGGSLGEAYELVFASAPQKEWDKGPAAANAWIKSRLPAPEAENQPELEPPIRDEPALKAWLEGQSRQVAVAIAARAMLRAFPIVVRAGPITRAETKAEAVAKLTSAIFRVGALGNVVKGDGPGRSAHFTAFHAAHDAAAALADAYASASETQARRVSDRGLAAVARAAAYVAAVPDGAADSLAAHAVAWAASALAADQLATGAIDLRTATDLEAPDWAEVRRDAYTGSSLGAESLATTPLWTNGAPAWATAAWIELKTRILDGRGLGRLDRVVRRSPARRFAQRGERAGFRQRSAGGVGPGTCGGERLDQGSFA